LEVCELEDGVIRITLIILYNMTLAGEPDCGNVAVEEEEAEAAPAAEAAK